MLKMKYSIIWKGKRKGIPPKCLLHVAIQTEKDQYTLIEQPAHGLVKIVFTNTTQLYN